ncbi:MAG: HDOD domain-containing protein, partial [Deltaproteobacteria bacterium]|nr:HDOD domain-containing protein [Deltaproteobacteria bacterium]
LKGLALTAHVFASFESQGLGGFSPELFQAYSVRVARLAKRFLEGRSNADEAFSAGLLHDLGKMIIAVRLPTRFAAITSLVAESKAPLYQIERDLIGVTHAEIGAYLLGMWGLPHAIVEAVALHHTPGQVKPRPGGDYAALAAVHAADALLGIYSCFDPEDLLDLEFLERAGFAHDLPRWHELAKEEAAKMAQ